MSRYDTLALDLYTGRWLTAVTHAKDQGAIAEDDVGGIVVTAELGGVAISVGVDRHDGRPDLS